MVIKKVSFKHGWWYFYRIHEPKTDQLTKQFPELKYFLYDVFNNCPHDYFAVDPRSSKLHFNLSNLNLKPIQNHEVNILAKNGLETNANRFTTAHPKVQMFMLEEDSSTIAIEVPLWLHANELSGYEKIFNSKNPLTGHIDALRVEDDKIWIWDYKPNAHKEKHASTQTFFYAYMLSKRTQIPLENFRCGYFDSNNTYVFNPEKCKVPKVLQEKLLK
ncbi:PD-(D/E)XK nuclease family protein [Candidatus Woesearchaeota archaeon]|nr:PD-(D/E)XK nuclease family protein [Candidatus Woesearchaeota archaeon]